MYHGFSYITSWRIESQSDALNRMHLGRIFIRRNTYILCPIAYTSISAVEAGRTFIACGKRDRYCNAIFVCIYIFCCCCVCVCVCVYSFDCSFLSFRPQKGSEYGKINRSKIKVNKKKRNLRVAECQPE